MTKKCIRCNKLLKEATFSYKGVHLEALQCPRCGEKIFTESLAMQALDKLEAHRLQSFYVKHPIQIGHSWGFTFPKEVAEVFGLNNGKVTFKLHPDFTKKKIEIVLTS